MVLLGIGVFGCAAALGLAPQEPDAAAPPVEVVATVTVDDTEQFCPTTWRLRIEVPAGGDVVSTEPFVQVQRRTADGAWESPPEMDDARSRPPMGWDDGGGSPRPPVWWRLRAGASETYVGEVRDWRVLGNPGIYRVRVLWGVRGDIKASSFASDQFEVRPAGVDGAALVAAKQAHSQLWAAYEQFCNCSYRIVVPPPYRLQQPGYPRAGDPAVAALVGLRFQPFTTLLAAETLPAAVRARAEVFLLCRSYDAANALPDGEERTQGLRRCIADYTAAAARTGHVGALARLQLLVLMKAYGSATEFEAAVVGARQDSDLLGLGLWFPEAMLAVGLAEQQPYTPTTEERERAVGVPRSYPPIIYERR